MMIKCRVNPSSMSMAARTPLEIWVRCSKMPLHVPKQSRSSNKAVPSSPEPEQSGQRSLTRSPDKAVLLRHPRETVARTSPVARTPLGRVRRENIEAQSLRSLSLGATLETTVRRGEAVDSPRARCSALQLRGTIVSDVAEAPTRH